MLHGSGRTATCLGRSAGAALWACSGSYSSERFGYNHRLESTLSPRSMKVVQLICNHQVLVRFRPGAPTGTMQEKKARPRSVAQSLLPVTRGLTIAS